MTQEYESLVEEFDLEPESWDELQREEKTAFIAALVRQKDRKSVV